MQLVRAIRREFGLLLTIVFNLRTPWIAKLAVVAGLGYLFVPLDIIPDHIRFFGHLDEATSVFVGFAFARTLVKPIAADLGSHGLAGGQHHPIPLRAPERTNIDRPTNYLFRLLGYRCWWLVNTPIARPRSSIQGLIIVGGAARSGTTMFRTVLGRHAMLASGPETTVFLRRITSPQHLGPRLMRDPAQIERWQAESRSQVEFIERFHHAMLTDTGRPIWVEKTPANVFRFGFVKRNFPHAKLVHVVRDGRDSVCSLRRQPWAKIGRDVVRDSPEAARRCGVMWAASVKAGLAHRGDPRYYEVRYEDLVGAPEETLRRLLDFLGLPWSDQLLVAPRAAQNARFAPASWSGTGPSDVHASFENDATVASGRIFDASVGRWRHDLSAADIAALAPVIGDLLIELGYEHSDAWANGFDPARSTGGHRYALSPPAARVEDLAHGRSVGD